ncbi:YdcF family protein [bacterium]|nr:YdcF family protein [bacterium]
MFFIISKVLTVFTDPLVYILLLAFIGVLKFKKRIFSFALFLIFYLISTPVVSQRLLFSLEHLKSPSLVEKQYDAVVVLSGMLNLNMSSSNTIEFEGAVDRVLSGIGIMRSKTANYLILSGGDGSLIQKGRSEASLLADFSEKMGVTKDRILVDQDSRNTFENAVNTKKIIDEHQFKKILLITSAFHMFRAQGCFNRVGIKVDLLPVDFGANLTISDFRYFLPSSDALSSSNRFIHEAIGIIAYGLSGKARYF